MSIYKNMETLLPCGEKLKPLLNKSSISDSDMKELLSSRGVYTGKSNKKYYIPILTMSIISPREFEYLQEKQKTKEDSIKYRTKRLETSMEMDLYEAISLDLIDSVSLIDCTSSVEFNTDVSFSVDNENKMVVDYELLRCDITKDWVDGKSTHSGRVIIQKDTKDNKILFKNEFTSSETYDVNEEIIKQVRNKLVLDGFVKTDAKMISIKSDDLDNKDRFKFMLQLANDSNNQLLVFDAVKNIEIGPDENAVLPDEARWMANSVKKMIINGEDLQNIEYVKNSQYHESLILREIEAKYKFKTASSEGTCIIEYGFPHYFRKKSKDTNFQASISKVYFNRNSNSSNLANTSRVLLNEFEEMKDYVYEQISGKKK